MLWKKPVNPTLITVVSLPAFLLGGLLAGVNLINLGQEERGRNTIRKSFWGTVFILMVMFFTPGENVIKLWPVWLGINLGVGMALRKLQQRDYEVWKLETN